MHEVGEEEERSTSHIMRSMDAYTTARAHRHIADKRQAARQREVAHRHNTYRSRHTGRDMQCRVQIRFAADRPS